MIFKQFYLKCLAHASYFIADENEAVIVDPQRDVDIYIDEAQKNGLKIKAIIETHLHADFVSGHLELAKRTGAEIYVGHLAKAGFEHKAVKNGDGLQLGNIQMKFLETPGHTPEGISVLIDSGDQTPLKLLTGDTLFIGEVGRPDLVASVGYDADDMASMLYDSLRNVIMTLPDSTEIYPAHGAGSACGKKIGKEKSSTLAKQKENNYALQEMNKDEFIAMITKDLPKAPDYFSHDVQMNKGGAKQLEELPKLLPLNSKELSTMKGLVTLLDVRTVHEYSLSHIEGSINIGLNGAFAPWVGEILIPTEAIIVVANSEEQSQEAQLRLARIGYENVLGYLDKAFLNSQNEDFKLIKTPLLSADEMKELLEGSVEVQLVDVRKPDEFKGGYIMNAVNIPLNELNNRLDELDANKKVACNCAGGYRSTLALSILEKNGFKGSVNLDGGIASWKDAGLSLSPSNTNKKRDRE